MIFSATVKSPKPSRVYQSLHPFLEKVHLYIGAALPNLLRFQLLNNYNCSTPSLSIKAMTTYPLPPPPQRQPTIHINPNKTIRTPSIQENTSNSLNPPLSVPPHPPFTTLCPTQHKPAPYSPKPPGHPTKLHPRLHPPQPQPSNNNATSKTPAASSYTTPPSPLPPPPQVPSPSPPHICAEYNPNKDTSPPTPTPSLQTLSRTAPARILPHLALEIDRVFEVLGEEV